MGNSERFGMYIQHGGKFYVMEGSNHYVGGTMVPRFDFQTDIFSYEDIENEVGRLGYVSWKSICYKVPNSFNYRLIQNDDDAMEMVSHISDRCRVIHIFVDAGKLAETDEVDEVSAEVQFTNYEDEYNLDYDIEVEDAGHNREESSRKVTDEEHEKDGEMTEGDSDEEDGDYIPEEIHDYTDDELPDDEFASDEEYTEARRVLRDRSDKGLCDEVFTKVGHECGYSDYEQSDGDVNSDETDEEGDRVRRRNNRAVYDPRRDHRTLKLEMYMRFADGLEARDAIRRQAIEDGREIHFKRVSKTQMEAKCNPPCKWRVYGSLVKANGHFEIKKLHLQHTCTTAIRNKIVTSDWIAKEYLNVFRYRPDLTVRELGQDIVRRYNCHVLKWKLYKAKDKAITMLRGTVEEHYAKLRSYILELKRVDNEGRFELNVEVGAVFKGIYIGFSSLRKGFKAGCRTVIGVDGAFLKTYLGGVLLCAVATDANSSMYPIAWAVVEIENLENWSWLLRILVDDLQLSTGAGITFISDQQKGLLRAVHEQAPLADHRNCARHVFINWKKSNKGLVLKHLFWRIVRSTNLAEYNKALDTMKKTNISTYEDFIGRDTTKFCKVFFNPHTVSDTLLNNISETFNGYILNARGKHVIHMLEEIRISLMERLFRKKEEFRDYNHRICPEIVKKVEEKKKFSRYCIAHASSEFLFEVENYGHRFVVDIQNRTCSCRGWDLSGIPCIHACAAIHIMRDGASNYCNEAYTVDKYKETYKFSLPPLNGESMWPAAEGYPVLPPIAKKMPGRPKKKRKRDPNEGKDGKRYGLKMTCRQCKQMGHNRKTCKNEPVVTAPKPKGKTGRPQKPQTQQTPMHVGASNASTSDARVSSTSSARVAPSQGHGALSSTATRVESSTSGMTFMGAAENVFTTMPAERRENFVPPRPTMNSPVGQKARKTRKKHISTQESQV